MVPGGLVTEPRRVPAGDAGHFPLDRRDGQPALGVAPAGGLLQHGGEGIGFFRHPLGEVSQPGVMVPQPPILAFGVMDLDMVRGRDRLHQTSLARFPRHRRRAATLLHVPYMLSN